MDNFVEQLVAEHFKSKGYLVLSNYWFPIQSVRTRIQQKKEQVYNSQSWTDIDVLARNANELLVIQVKAIINQENTSKKIIDFYKNVNDFLKIGKSLDGSSDISWWSSNVNVKHLVVYENYSPPTYLDKLRDNGIDVIQFSEIFKELLEYLKEREGVKEQNATMRFIHFLMKYKFLSI